MNFDELKTEFKINFDSYDGFGSAMSALFTFNPRRMGLQAKYLRS